MFDQIASLYVCMLTWGNFTESLISKHGDWHNALLSPPSAMAGLLLTSLMQQLISFCFYKSLPLHMHEGVLFVKEEKTSHVPEVWQYLRDRVFSIQLTIDLTR